MTIIRPGPVLGPRDRDFLAYFALVKRGLSVQVGRWERLVSLVFIRDLVSLILLALESDVSLGQIYYASSHTNSRSELAESIGRALQKRLVRVALPELMLSPISLVAEGVGLVFGRAPLLNRQRALDMRQRNWVCSGDKARRDLGFVPEYTLDAAVAETCRWYQENGWL
jgi:nucleoside-diphosphate-sugar epimerase